MTTYTSSEEEWSAVATDITAKMTDFLKQYRTPLFRDLGAHAAGEGTGSYLELGSGLFVLTNEHVAACRETGGRLVHKFHDCDDFFLVAGNHASQPLPFDLSIIPVSREMWEQHSHNSKAISVSQISMAHTPVPNEILVLAGFAGEDAVFRFGAMTAVATTSVSREVSLPKTDNRFSGRFHFGIAYNPNLATKVVGRRDLPRPPGLSGSTVWNTRFVECQMQGKPWTPEQAMVTGVVWGWPSNIGCLVAIRAEYVRSFLLEAAVRLKLGI